MPLVVVKHIPLNPRGLRVSKPFFKLPHNRPIRRDRGIARFLFDDPVPDDRLEVGGLFGFTTQTPHADVVFTRHENLVALARSDNMIRRWAFAKLCREWLSRLLRP